MIINYAYKFRIYPTEQQKVLLNKHFGCNRFIWNYFLNERQQYYLNNKEDIEAKRIKGSLNYYDNCAELTKLKKQDNYKWLNEVGSKVSQESLRNLDKAFKQFFKTKKGYPKFKSKKRNKQSFYIRVDRLYFKDGICNIEKIGKVKYKTKHEIPKGKYSNPYCVYNGKKWLICLGIEFNENQVELNKDLKIGIDLGIKDLAICSNGMVFKNINKTKRVKNLQSKLKHLQRNVSRKYEANKQGRKYIKTNNIIKLEKQIALIYKKLADIRNNHIYQSINTIIKERPYKIIMEDLNITGMMKNKTFI